MLIAVGRANSDGYEVEVYSAENVAAFVAVAREKYFRWRVVNSPESGRQERTNLHQNFDAYNPAQVERKILRLAKGDILVLAGGNAHFGLAPRIGWRFGYHRSSHGGASRDETMVSALHFGFRGTVPAIVTSEQLVQFTIGQDIRDYNI